MMLIGIVYVSALAAVFILFLRRSKRLRRVREASLEQRLMASALINPDDGKFYF